MSRKRRIAVTIAVMLGLFLAALEATVVSTAMPTVVASLGGIERYSWVFSAYLVSSTVTVPIWGKLSDLFGRRRLFQIGIAVFLVGSVLCGFAASMNQLIVYRALQGLGAGALVPLPLTIVGEIYTVEERSRMQGVFSGVWGFASIIGPLIGGFITDTLSWHWVFFINIPFGILAAVVMGVSLVERERKKRPSIDYAGATTMTLSVVLLLFALVEGGQNLGWLHPVTIGCIAGSVLFGSLFVRAERRADEPIVPLDLFRDRTFSASTVCGFFVGVAMFGTVSFIPLFVQGVSGTSATQAGSVLTPLLLSWVVMSILGGRLITSVGVRPLTVTGTILLAASFLLLTRFGSDGSYAALLGVMALMGSGMGLIVVTLILAVQASSPSSRLGIATSFTMFARSIGGAFGVAVFGTVLAISLSNRLDALGVSMDSSSRINPNILLDPVARAGLSPEMLSAMVVALAQAMHQVFWLGTIVAAVALVTAFSMPRSLSHVLDLSDSTSGRPQNVAT